MNKIGIRVLSAVLVGSLVVLPVSANPSIDDLKKDKQAAQSEVDSLQEKLTEIVSQIDELERKLISTGEQIDQATVDLAEAQAQEEQQYEDMKLRIKYMYEEGNSSVAEALLTSSDFSELVNKAEYVQNVHEYDREKLQEYVETKEKVETLKTTLEEEQSELESLETEYQAQEDDLNTTISEKQNEVDDLDGMIQTAIEEAEAEEAARKAAEEAAAAAAAATDTQTADATDSSDNTTTTDTTKDDTDEDDSDSTSSAAVASYTAGDAVSRAYAELGKPYKWGAVGPDAYDCSGLVSYCLTGRHVRAYTSGSLAGCTRVTDPQPGDVCVKVGHVGIYIGNGMMIHAPHTGDVVKISAVQSGMWYVRP